MLRAVRERDNYYFLRIFERLKRTIIERVDGIKKENQNIQR